MLGGGGGLAAVREADPDGGRPNPLPQLPLTGKWLEPLGFTTGRKIKVLAAPGQLIVRLATEG